MKRFIFLPLFAALLALGGCNTTIDGDLTPPGDPPIPPTLPLDGGVIAPSTQTINPGETPVMLENVKPAWVRGDPPSYFYLWQSSTDNINWVNVLDLNASLSYQPGPLTETTYFRRKVNVGRDMTNYSNTVVVNVTGNIIFPDGWEPGPSNPPLNTYVTYTLPQEAISGMWTISPNTYTTIGGTTNTVLNIKFNEPGEYNFLVVFVMPNGRGTKVIFQVNVE